MPLSDNHQAPQSTGKAGKSSLKGELSRTLPRNHGFVYKEQRISRLFPLGFLCVTRLYLDSRCPNSTFFILFPRIHMCFSFFQSAAELSRRPSLKFFFAHRGLLSFSFFVDFTCLTEFRRISFCKTK